MKRKVTNEGRTVLLLILAGLFAAIGLVLTAGVPSQAGGSTALQICPPPDSPVCMVRCLAHKRTCWNACRVRKRQCFEEARAEALACKLECRDSGASDGDVGQCRRRCVATAIAKAKGECKLGFPVCYRECNPESCRELCQPDASTGSLGGIVSRRPLPTTAATDCRPPVDRECLGQCASDLKICARRVVADGKQCLASCREFEGADRRQCIRDCVDKTVAAGKECVATFRECVVGCKPVSDPQTPVDPTGSADPAAGAAIG